ncbi:MAG TPA: hypothetical protein VJZ26_03170 [Blastocatellia bacterium]|nr:hypothetical protein [Blastocatellia bacterium]
MDSAEEESGAIATDPLNYFNYFTEVEEEFVRRRGKPLLVSPLDWALIESWKTAGIPLHIVLRAINRAFDAYDARPRKYRKVNSVFYCQQEVESSFADYRLSQVGGGPEAEGEKPARKPGAKSKQREQETAEAFPKQVLLDFMARSDGELSAAAALASGAGRTEVESAIERARARLIEMAREIEISAQVDAEAIERDLDAIDRMILRSATETCGEDGVEAIRREAESQLQPYSKKMDKTIYQQTVQNFISRRLREMNNVPRLSLFYL